MTKRIRSLIAVGALAAVALVMATPPVAHAADITVQTVTEAGVVPSYAGAATGGDRFANGAEDVVCHAKNLTAATSITVTIPANDNTRDATGLGPVTKADGGSAVAAGAEKLFGPFPRLAYNGSDGKVSITYSSVPLACQAGSNAGAVCTVDSMCPGSTCSAGLRVACFRVPRTR